MAAATEKTGRALVIGTGRMARLRIPALQAAGLDVSVTGRDLGRTQHTADRLSATAVDYRDATFAAYDCAVVASASEDHLTDVHNFMSTAPIMLCEKPVATDAAQAGRLAEVLASKGTELFVGFQRRFDPGFAALRDRVLHGDFGTLLHLRLTDFDHQPGSFEFITKSGGMFKDLVIHDLDLLTWVTGSAVKAVHANGSVLISDDYRELGDCDIATVSVVLDTNALATINTTRIHPLGQDVRIEVIGVGAAVSVGLTVRTPLTPMEEGSGIGSQTPPKDFIQRFAAAFNSETSNFANYVMGQTHSFNGCTFHEAVNALIVADACERSWRSGQKMEIDAVGRWREAG